MAKKRFDTELDREWIDVLVKMPLERRKMELQHCDLHSLAKAMSELPNWQSEKIAEALQKPLPQEFIKAVKIYKGELPFPKKIRKRIPVLSKSRLAASIFSVVLLIVLIFVLNVLFPS